MSRYRISVRSLKGDILTFRVDEYEIKDGFLTFTDEVTGKLKVFHSANCEIESEGDAP